MLHGLAHEVTEGRWVATGGGGYQWARVVPRAWTIAFAEMSASELADEIPAAWVETMEDRLGDAMPTTFSEPAPADDALDPATEETIDAVKRTCFPFFGLEP